MRFSKILAASVFALGLGATASAARAQMGMEFHVGLDPAGRLFAAAAVEGHMSIDVTRLTIEARDADGRIVARRDWSFPAPIRIGPDSARFLLLRRPLPHPERIASFEGLLWGEGMHHGDDPRVIAMDAYEREADVVASHEGRTLSVTVSNRTGRRLDITTIPVTLFPAGAGSATFRDYGVDLSLAPGGSETLELPFAMRSGERLVVEAESSFHALHGKGGYVKP